MQQPRLAINRVHTSALDCFHLSASTSGPSRAYLQDRPHGGEQQALLRPRRPRLPQHHVQQRVVANVRPQAHAAGPVAGQKRSQRGQHLIASSKFTTK